MEATSVAAVVMGVMIAGFLTLIGLGILTSIVEEFRVGFEEGRDRRA